MSGALPEVIPVPTGSLKPQILPLASLSKLGIWPSPVSVFPVSGFGKPPRPSSTSNIILLVVGWRVPLSALE